MTLSSYRDTLGKPSFLFGNATSALKDYLGFLRRVMPDKRTVLLPSYICANVYSAVLAVDCTVRFYDVDAGLSIDLARVEAELPGDTLAIVWVHFFGRENGVAGARALADRHGIALIEDCAHTIGAESAGVRLGTVGHAAILSLWKTLRITDGGMLVVNEPSHAGFSPRPSRRMPESAALMGYLIRRLRRTLEGLRGAPVSRSAESLTPVFAVDLDAARAEGVASMSSVSQFWAGSVDLDRMKRLRRTHYQFWEQQAREFSGVTPLFGKLPEGAVPFSYPVLVRPEIRDELRRALWVRGILCGAGFPEAPFEHGHDAARVLSRSLIELPVHHEVTDNDLRIAKTILAAWHDASPPTSPTERISP